MNRSKPHAVYVIIIGIYLLMGFSFQDAKWNEIDYWLPEIFLFGSVGLATIIDEMINGIKSRRETSMQVNEKDKKPDIMTKDEDRYYFFNNRCSVRIAKDDINGKKVEKNGLKHTLITKSMMFTIIEMRDEMPNFGNKSIQTENITVGGFPCLVAKVSFASTQYFIDCDDFVVQINMSLPSKEFLHSFRVEDVADHDIKWDQVGKYHNGLARVVKDNRFGFINQDNEVVIPLIFDYVFDFVDRLTWVKKDGKYGFINIKGEVIVDIVYDLVEGFKDEMAPIIKDKKVGFIGLDGEEIIPREFDGFYIIMGNSRDINSYSFISNGVVKLLKDGVDYYFLKGEKITGEQTNEYEKYFSNAILMDKF